MQPILYESLHPSVLLCKQEENILESCNYKKAKVIFGHRYKWVFKVWEVMQGIFSDVIITACHHKHESKKQQLIVSLSVKILNIVSLL